MAFSFKGWKEAIAAGIGLEGMIYWSKKASGFSLFLLYSVITLGGFQDVWAREGGMHWWEINGMI